MGLPRMRTPRGSIRRRVALWSALAMGSILPSVGCQVEYAGMTLPSGRYMHDDVQYFPSGPDFPWANTQAASQRARMRAMGIEPAPAGAPVPPGFLDPTQMPYAQGGRATNVNTQPGVMPPGGPVQPQPLPPGAGQLPNVPVPGAPPAVAPPAVQPPAPGDVPAPGNP
jgi:hypothetical protein